LKNKRKKEKKTEGYKCLPSYGGPAKFRFLIIRISNKYSISLKTAKKTTIYFNIITRKENTISPSPLLSSLHHKVPAGSLAWFPSWQTLDFPGLVKPCWT